MSEVEIAKQFDYKSVKFETPSPNEYRYAKLYPQNASQNVTLLPGATTPVTIELPTDVYNLSRAFLQYTISQAATAGVVNITYKDLMSHIQQIQLITKNQILVADIQNVPLYTKAVWKPEIKYEDYKVFENFKDRNGYGCMLTQCNAYSKQLISTVTTAAGAVAVNQNAIRYNTDKLSTYRVYPCISPNNGGGANAPLKFTLSSSVATTFVGLIGAATASDQTPSNSVPYDEPQYFEIGPSRNVNNPTYNIRFPLSLLLNSIFSVDKDFYFNGEIMYLKIFFSPSIAVYFTSNLANADIASTNGVSTTAGGNVYGAPCSDLVQDTTPGNQVVVYTIAAPTVNVNVTNLTLWLPINRDPSVRELLEKKIADPKGMRVNIPFIWTSNQAFAAVASAAGVLPATGSQNVELKYNTSHGKRLLKLYYTLLNADGTGALSNLQYDISNLGYTSTGGQNTGVLALAKGYKLQQFQTFLDNRPLQDYIVDCTNGDHYTLQLPYLKDSVILNSNMYDYNFCWIERFDDLISPADRPYPVPEDNLIVGLDLSVERKYTFQSICNQYFALTHYIFAVTQRELIISSQGIMLDQP